MGQVLRHGGEIVGKEVEVSRNSKMGGLIVGREVRMGKEAKVQDVIGGQHRQGRGERPDRSRESRCRGQRSGGGGPEVCGGGLH